MGLDENIGNLSGEIMTRLTLPSCHCHTYYLFYFICDRSNKIISLSHLMVSFVTSHNNSYLLFQFFFWIENNIVIYDSNFVILFMIHVILNSNIMLSILMLSVLAKIIKKNNIERSMK